MKTPIQISIDKIEAEITKVMESLQSPSITNNRRLALIGKLGGFEHSIIILTELLTTENETMSTIFDGSRLTHPMVGFKYDTLEDMGFKK